jgi:Alpha/beta hydrolase family
MAVYLYLLQEPQCYSFNIQSLVTKEVTARIFSSFYDSESLILSPEINSKNKHLDATAIILLPGCQLKPQQYHTVARRVQDESNRPTYVVVPKMPLDIPNPLVVPAIVQRALEDLQKAGYQSDKVFIGGHSLGGVFLPDIICKDGSTPGLQEDQILGMIYLGSFLARGTTDDSVLHNFPSLTLTGDLDGMVRVSRIAEDYHRNVVSKLNSTATMEEAQLHHSVVLVEGMNHFGFVRGKAPFMKQLRDLPQEISHEEAASEVAKSIASFMRIHQSTEGRINAAKSYLLHNIQRTVDYLQPMLDALELEGSRNVGCDPSVGSIWTSEIQLELLKKAGVPNVGNLDIADEFRPSWYLNPLAKVPFYHPKVEKAQDGTVFVKTMTDPIYEKTDEIFDGGFFSNTVHELRCKFNSPQATLEKIKGRRVPFDTNHNFAKDLNQIAIDWAMAKAPQRVLRRYIKDGAQLVTGDDISHNNGLTWIWSYLSFKKTNQRECQVRSHVMTTPTDHPIPAAGGKMYCKVLSPAKVLDFMYTDSLRQCSMESLFSVLPKCESNNYQLEPDR